VKTMHIGSADEHPFLTAPNKTLIQLAVPVLFALVAEPLTGLADTAFVARLPGSEPVAALGIGTVAFSSIFWAFSFLGIGTQTEIAQAVGRGAHGQAIKVVSLAALLAACIGCALMLLAYPALDMISGVLGAQGGVGILSWEYMLYRLFGAPAVLVVVACFGAFRGVQDMRTPMYVAVGINVLNVILDWLLIFGVGPFPAMGVGGAAIASSISQWCGAIWALFVVSRRLGLTVHVYGAGLAKLMKIGGDLFMRTGMVLLFLGLCTRYANQTGADEGAAYQAIRQFFIFSALFLDAFAVTGQSLVGYFLGAGAVSHARRVAAVVCRWSVGTGVCMCIAMLLGEQGVVWLLVPPTAYEVFGPAWLVVALTQPIGSLSFATDGIHWGTGDFRYLRNVMFIAVGLSFGLLVWMANVEPGQMLVVIWSVTALWAFIRAGFGLARVWPGIGDAPLAVRT